MKHSKKMTAVKYLFLTLSLLLGHFPLSFSQKQVRQELRKGNKDYRQEKYTDAEIDYRKALEANARSTEAAYNLGNALYKQQKFPEAMEQYQAVSDDKENPVKTATTWHNIGNVFMNNKEYEKSIDAYKQALRRNPGDDETRYNLALAQKLLEDQQQQDQDQDQKQDQQQDKKKEEEQKQDQQQQQQDQQQQQNPEEMQKENAEQMLNAMMQNERETQDKVKEKQMKQMKQRKTDKNW